MSSKPLRETTISALSEQHDKIVGSINEMLKSFPPVPTTNRDEEKAKSNK